MQDAASLWRSRDRQTHGGAGTDSHSTELHKGPPDVKGTAPIRPWVQQLIYWLCLQRKKKTSRHRERATYVRQNFPVRDTGYGMGHDGMGHDGMGWDGMGWDGMGWDGMGWDGMGHFAVSRACESPILRHRSPARACHITPVSSKMLSHACKQKCPFWSLATCRIKSRSLTCGWGARPSH